MGKTRRKIYERSSRTPPSSPTHSSSSQSDFEFLISPPSPNKLSSSCPSADELFFKGRILPLHISPRLSMLQSLGPSSSRDSTATSRDSTSSSNDLFSLSNESSCNSSTRPSSVTEELELLPHHDLNQKFNRNYRQVLGFDRNLDRKQQIKKPIKYFSLSRFSSVFRKDQSSKNRAQTVVQEQGMNSVKKMKDMVSKYIKKVKPFYEKFSSSSNKQQSSSSSIKDRGLSQSQSFSENILYPRNNKKNGVVSSCPSSMRSSPSRKNNSLIKWSSSSSIEEVQNAIQGAIAHCKKSYSKSSDS